jgi:hypothetical protein
MSADRDAGLLDSEVPAGLRAGDLSVLRTLLDRHYALTVCFVRALAPDTDAARMVGQVWERVVADGLTGWLSGDLRVALLGRLSALIPEPPRADVRAVEQLGTFERAKDLASRKDPVSRISRWEGWWDKEPPTWPPGREPRPDEVLAALRRLPFRLRRLLILRDVARLTAEDARMVTGSDEDASEVPLQLARDAYVVELDREIGGDDGRRAEL